MKKYVGLWLLIIMSYLMEFGVPLVAAYFLFTHTGGVLTQVQVYGGVFFAVATGVAVSFYARIKAILKTIEIGYAKLSFKLFASLIVFFALYNIVLNVQANTDGIIKLLLITVMGQLLSYGFKMFAVRVDKEYVNKIGVFN